MEKEKSNAIRKQFGIDESSFLAAFGGNIGMAAGVDTLIKASEFIPYVHILIAGEGSDLSACRTLASQLAPNRISFFSPWPKEQTMALYQAADVLVLPTRGAQSVASIPSKLIRYMLSGRPVIAASLPGTELECVVKQSQCGWVIPPDDPRALAQAVFEARNLTTEERYRYGTCGRKYAIKNFTAANNLPKMVSILEQIPTRREKMIREQDRLMLDDLIVIAGAGGFIGGSLAKYFRSRGFQRIRGVDKKPITNWYQRVPGVECLCMDLSESKNAVRAVEGQ